MNNLKCSVCVCVGASLICWLLPLFVTGVNVSCCLVRYNLVFHLINIEVVFSCLTFWSQGKVFQIWDKMSLSNVLIVQAAGEAVFSMGTVWADTALFGQPVLVISARRYSQSMVALSLSLSLSLFSMGTVWADTALFGQPVLVISARLYSQSMVALSLSLSLSLFSMGTVWADTALFGQPVLVISARRYSQSMVALSLSLSLSLLHGYSMGRYGSLSGSQCW